MKFAALEQLDCQKDFCVYPVCVSPPANRRPILAPFGLENVVAAKGEIRMALGQEHELRRLFHDVVGQCYGEGIGIRDEEMTSYVADLLTEFCEADRLYKIHDQQGRALADVGEMLLESDPVFGPAHSFDREREVRKHVGDYSLFFAGMFPDALHQWMRRQRISSLLELVHAGKQSYYVVSKFDVGEYAEESRLFARLAECFESCVYGLNLVRGELDRRKYLIGGPQYAGLLM